MTWPSLSRIPFCIFVCKMLVRGESLLILTSSYGEIPTQACTFLISDKLKHVMPIRSNHRFGVEWGKRQKTKNVKVFHPKLNEYSVKSQPLFFLKSRRYLPNLRRTRRAERITRMMVGRVLTWNPPASSARGAEKAAGSRESFLSGCISEPWTEKQLKAV